MEDFIVKTIPGNMYHLNTCEINFTKSPTGRWLLYLLLEVEVVVVVVVVVEVMYDHARTGK